MSIRVAIIEDDAPAREIFVDWIENAPDFECVGQYGSAEQALAELPARKPEVVLVDIRLPGMSGVECISRLKPLLPGTQFLVLTVYEDADYLFNALAAGASGYLLKQTSAGQLLAALKEVQAGGSPMSSTIARKVVQSFRQPGVQTVDSDELTSREREVLELLAAGDLYKEIANQLGISYTTVNTHVRRIYEKLHVHSRFQLLAKYTKAPRKRTRASASPLQPDLGDD